MPTIVIIPQEALQGFVRPALDLTTGQIIELEPASEQLELFTEVEQPPAPLDW